MDIQEELAKFAPDRPTLLTIGVFDGVHLGHRYLLDRLIARAEEKGCLAGVVTFKTHPEKVLRRRDVLPWICSLQERVRLLKAAGVDVVVPLTFTRSVADLTAREFVVLLKKHLKMCDLVLGPDFAMGRGRQGDPAYLRKVGKELDFDVEVMKPARLGNEVISSSAIRRLLAEGNVSRAGEMLGRPFTMEGRVVMGDRRGRLLGFPTANMKVHRDHAVPGDGIYATIVHREGRQLQSVTNIGRRPTFAGLKRLIETYIMDFNGDLYGRKLRIQVVSRLRDEMRFDSVEDLKRQMARDVAQARKVLGKTG